MTRLFRLAVCLIICVLMAVVHSSTYAQSSVRIDVGPFASVHSATFNLAAGQALKLSTDTPGLNLDAFVYRAGTHELVAKSDDQDVGKSYEWGAVEAGQYYMVMHNVTPAHGVATVAVLTESTREGAQTNTPTSVVMKVFYATDRQITAEHSDKGTTYGTEPSAGDVLQYGVARVSIPRSHEMGELEGPSIYRLEFKENPEKHVILLSATQEKAQSFYENVSARVRESAQHEALVFVHGFNVGFDDAARRTAQIAYDLGFDGAAILYSWPSQGSLFDYEKDVRNADLSVANLMSFLSDVSTRTGAKTIHVIAHSMGNRVVVQALARLANGSQEPQIRLRHVALIAPDFDAAEFRQLAVAMKKSADDITLYASSGDAALKASQKLSGYPRAGEGGDNIVVIPGVIETIDCSAVDTSLLGLGHSYYADNSTILSDLFSWFHGDPARSRFRLKTATNRQGQYWIFAAAAR